MKWVVTLIAMLFAVTAYPLTFPTPTNVYLDTVLGGVLVKTNKTIYLFPETVQSLFPTDSWNAVTAQVGLNSNTWNQTATSVAGQSGTWNAVSTQVGLNSGTWNSATTRITAIEGNTNNWNAGASTTSVNAATVRIDGLESRSNTWNGAASTTTVNSAVARISTVEGQTNTWNGAASTSTVNAVSARADTLEGRSNTWNGAASTTTVNSAVARIVTVEGQTNTWNAGASTNSLNGLTARFNTVTNGYGILYDGGTISLDTASGILTNLGAANISDLTVSNGTLNLTNCTGLGIVSGSAVATQAAIAVGSALTNVAGALGVGGLSTTGLVMAGSNIVMSGTLRMSTNATPSNGKTLSLYAGDANAQQVFDFVPLGQTVRNWTGMTCDQSNNVYACVNSGNIYRQANGVGNFVTLGQTTRSWFKMTCDQSNNVYACVNSGNIYRQANGTGDFIALVQTSRNWFGMTCDQSNNVYACVYNGDIYRQANGTGDFIALNQTARKWFGMTCDQSNNVYACVMSGNIYRQANGTGDFVTLGQTTTSWTGMTCDRSNNVYACVNGGDIYRQANGVGNFVALNQTTRGWYGMTCDQSNNVYACVSGGDIYRMQDMTGTSYVGGDANISSGLGVGAGTSKIKFNLAAPSVDNFTPQTMTTAGTMTWNAFDYRGSFSAASLSTTGTANIASIVVSNGADIRGTLTAENYAGNGYGLTNLNLPSVTWASNAVAAASNDVVDAKAQIGAVSALVVAVTALVADLTNKVVNGFPSLIISQLTVPVRITLSNDLQIAGGQINGTNGFWMIQGATNYFIPISAAAAYCIQFDGQNYMESDGSESLLVSESFSVEAFVRQTATNSDHAPIIRAYLEDEEVGYYGWQLRFESLGESLCLDWRDGDQVLVSFDWGLSSFPRDAWVHVAFCWDGDNIYCFTNGVLVKTELVSSMSCGAVTAYSGMGDFSIAGAMISSGCKWSSDFTPPTSLSTNENTRYFWPCSAGTGSLAAETKEGLNLNFGGDPLPQWVTK